MFHYRKSDVKNPDQSFHILTANQAGVTLIELIVVIVMLSLITGMGAYMVSISVDHYQKIKNRSQMTLQGHNVIEQISRQLRMAFPSSIKVNSDGSCMEFYPISGSVAEVSSGYVAKAILELSDIDTFFSNLNGESEVLLISELFMLEDPKGFCVEDQILYSYEEYGDAEDCCDDSDIDFSGATKSIVINTLGDLIDNGGDEIVPFQLTNATEAHNTRVAINLPISNIGGEESVILNYLVTIKNEP